MGLILLPVVESHDSLGLAGELIGERPVVSVLVKVAALQSCLAEGAQAAVPKAFLGLGLGFGVLHSANSTQGPWCNCYSGQDVGNLQTQHVTCYTMVSSGSCCR